MTHRNGQIVPSADETRLIGPSSTGDAEADGGAAIGAGLDRQLGADQQGALAHASDAEAALGVVEGEAAAVVGDLESDAATVGTPQPHLHSAGATVAGGGGKRRLGRPATDRPGRRPAAREVAPAP